MSMMNRISILQSLNRLLYLDQLTNNNILGISRLKYTSISRWMNQLKLFQDFMVEQ
jgi:hypothetical protein